jgi:diguanylate cyclase (GGDEF)-like protein/PAS domain S-box-containing protein
MSPYGVYYLKHLQPLIEDVGGLLKGHGWAGDWLAIDSLEQARPGSLVIVDEAALGPERQPLMPARKVLVLLQQWSLDACAEWLAAGARACCEKARADRIAAELMTLRAQLEAAEVRFGDVDILQSVIDAIPVPIFYKDEFHVYRGCNVAFNDYIGLPPDKVVGHSVYDVAPAELADRYYAADEELLASGGTQRYEAPVRYADGSYRDIEFNKAVFHKPDGRVGGQVGVMLDVTERNRLMRQLEKFSHTDPLTGTGNRREFDAVAHRELRHHRHSGLPLSLLVLDVDHFKQINDQWGHAVGDQALRFLVDQCRSQLREADRLFRTGGEEFCMVLPRTDLEQARRVAERLCSHMRGQTLNLEGISLRMTVSIGVVELTGDDDIDESLERADQALYRAKREGRDRVNLALPAV